MKAENSSSLPKKVASFSSLIHGIDLDYEYICFDPRSFTSDWHRGLRCCKDQGFGDKHLIKGGGRKKRPEYLEPYLSVTKITLSWVLFYE